MAYIYDLTDTWNAGGTTFNAIKMNVTDSASASASKLVTLQTNGTEHFSVTKGGQGYFSGNVGIGTASPGAKLSVLGGALSSVTDLALNISSQLTTGRMGTYDTNTVSAIHTVFDATSVELSAGTTSGWVSGISVTGNNAVNYKGTIRFATASVERMRIDSVGNVGIGTSSPSTVYRQTINGDGSSVVGGLSLRNNGTETLAIGNITAANDVDSEIWNPRNGFLRFATNNTERMRIDSSGNLLVGTTSTSVYNSASATGHVLEANGTVQHSRSGFAAMLLNRTSSDGNIVEFFRDGTVVGSISVTGSATAYNTSSDYRLKNVDGPITNSGAYVDALKPVQGSWKSDGSRFIGLLAHEVQEVSETPIATGEKDGEQMQAMDYSAPELIANLIAEIQSLRARVAQLEGN
jgi:hypothetical protein